jgi:hypothetical protein
MGVGWGGGGDDRGGMAGLVESCVLRGLLDGSLQSHGATHSLNHGLRLLATRPRGGGLEGLREARHRNILTACVGGAVGVCVCVRGGGGGGSGVGVCVVRRVGHPGACAHGVHVRGMRSLGAGTTARSCLETLLGHPSRCSESSSKSRYTLDARARATPRTCVRYTVPLGT